MSGDQRAALVSQKLVQLVEIEEHLDVGRSSADKYVMFIRYMRETLKSGIKVKGIDVLRAQDAEREKYMALDLIAGEDSVKVLIQISNLYLEAYQTPDGRWFEFQHAEQLIPYSETLCGRAYVELEVMAGKTFAAIELGQQPLVEAVHSLAKSSEKEKIGESLFVVIQMVCESIRFKDYTSILSNSYEGRIPIPASMIRIEKNWRQLALSIKKCQEDGSGFRFKGNEGIDSLNMAKRYMGIMLHV